MKEWMQNHFNMDNMSISLKIFNVVHFVVTIGMLIVCIVVDNFFDYPVVMYITFGTALVFFLTMVEANRTGRITLCVIFMSIFFNFFYLPYIFISYNRYTCVIPIYFLFGLLYTILLLDRKKALILGISETIFYICLLAANQSRMLSDFAGLSAYDRRKMVYAAIIALVLCGICSGAAVRFRFLVYIKEHDFAEQLQANAMDAYIAKDMFLINMSHEIRTPMNAIVGNVDLLLDQDIDNHVRDNVYNILNSCNALLSITDELMDLSKAESHELVIYKMRYDFLELIMEIINMIAVRLMESQLEFYIDIDGNIPRYMYGDASKLRQIFINILNNAIKYTKEGHILLSISSTKDETAEYDNAINLIVVITDTGIGIKKEAIPDLFESYIRLDKDNDAVNRIEGTGLGLKICKDIVTEMKGDISVESEYGVGSSFKFTVPQLCDNSERLIPDIVNEDSRIICVDTDADHVKQYKKIFNALKVSYGFADSQEILKAKLEMDDYTHIFIPFEKIDEYGEFLKSRVGKEEIIVSAGIADYVESASFATIVIRPVHAINMAAALNHTDSTYVRRTISKGGFSIPSCTIMVVDDNFTNLNVASALLRKYEANVITASSGRECLRLLEENNVDMIFLDYMMPEMNGIDTLNCIRKLPNPIYKDMPIVALTANVVSGAREMFIESGFNDFIAKPIAVDKIEKSLRAFLPKELVLYKNDYE